MARSKTTWEKGSGGGKRPPQGPGWGGPASGNPASGKPASGIPASGVPAKYARSGGAAEDVKEALDVIRFVMRTSPYLETRLAAAVKLRAELVGSPVQRNVNFEGGDVSNLSDAELRAELARVRASNGTRAAEEDGPDQPDGMVH